MSIIRGVRTQSVRTHTALRVCMIVFVIVLFIKLLNDFQDTHGLYGIFYKYVTFVLLFDFVYFGSGRSFVMPAAKVACK